MEFESILTAKSIVKKYKGFTLNVEKFEIPKGFSTALIGENGAGKTTLLNILSGIRRDFKGEVVYFEGKGLEDEGVRDRIGYTSTSNYYFSNWSTKQVKEINKALFDDFDEARYDKIITALDIPVNNVKSIKGLSDGNKVKLMLAGVLSRKTDLLMLDEPASPLDPLMRSKLCDIIHKYIEEGQGERSVFFSTHNISDMENVTDYAIIMDKGSILEQGFVEELKEKYILVKGETADYDACKNVLLGINKSNYGFEGLCESSKLDRLAGVKVAYETATLSQICVGLMKAHSSIMDF